MKPKKKCCRSKPRCKRCPLVLHKVRKAELRGISGTDLDRVFKRARKPHFSACLRSEIVAGVTASTLVRISSVTP